MPRQNPHAPEDYLDSSAQLRAEYGDLDDLGAVADYEADASWDRAQRQYDSQQGWQEGRSV